MTSRLDLQTTCNLQKNRDFGSKLKNISRVSGRNDYIPRFFTLTELDFGKEVVYLNIMYSLAGGLSSMHA